jgi:hypothetical protein
MRMIEKAQDGLIKLKIILIFHHILDEEEKINIAFNALG